MRKKTMRALSLLLAVVLCFSILLLPAAAAEENSEQSQEETQAEDTGSAQTETEVEVPEVNVIEVPQEEETDVTPAEETAEPEQPQEDAAVEEDSAASDEMPDQDGDAVYTVSYYDGTTLIASESVTGGEAPIDPPAKRLDGTEIAGWTNELGEIVDLTSQVITTDTNYYSWSVPGLNTAEHSAYIKGMSDTTFAPTTALTRAQAAQLLYNLLSSTALGPKDTTFSDVSADDWYYTAVTTLASYGVLNGYSDGTFCPNRSMTRAEFVTVLVRMTGVVGTAGSFSDVSSDYWAYASIIAAAEQGWVTGYPDGTFAPANGISRAEAVTVLNRVLGRVPDETAIGLAQDAGKFTDVASSYWAYYNIMEAAISHGYTKSGSTETWTEGTYAVDTVEGDGLTVADGVLCYVKNGRKVYLTAGINKVEDGFLYAETDGYAVTADLYTTPNTATFANGSQTALATDNFNLIGNTLFYWIGSTQSAQYLTAGVNSIAGKSYYADKDGYNIRNNFGAGVVNLNGKLYISDGYCAIVTSGLGYVTASSTLSTIDLAGHLYEYTVYNSSGSIASSAMYYVQSDYSLLTNGWYTHLYFGSDGKYTTTDSELDAYVDNIILNQIGIDNNVTTQVQKLLKAYYAIRGGEGDKYTSSNYRYSRQVNHGYLTNRYNSQTMYDWQIDSAKQMFSLKYGMCYEWACAYLFLARRLGFNCYATVGEIFNEKDRHCWIMVEWDGQWHISDVEVEWGYIAGFYTRGVSYYWNLFDQTVSDEYLSSYTNPEYTAIKYFFSSGK